MSSQWNPFRTLKWDKTCNHSLWKKLGHTFYFFFGDLPRPNQQYHKPYQAGILDWLFLFSPKLLYQGCVVLNKARKDWPHNPLGYVLEIFITLILAILLCLTIPLLVIQAILALTLTIAVSPLVVIVDIFAGPGFKSREGFDQPFKRITRASHSFWLNPSTWATSAVITLITSFLILGINPEIFGLAAVYLGVIQILTIGMGALLLGVSTLWFIGEMLVPERILQDDSYYFPLLNYITDRCIWMRDHPTKSIVLSVFMGLALAFAIGCAIAFSAGVPADSFVSVMFDSMAHLLMSLIQAMGHLPGLQFLAAPDAVLLPIAQILSAVLFIIAPIAIWDSVLRFLYTRQTLDDNGNLVEEEEKSILFLWGNNEPELRDKNSLLIDDDSLFSSIDPAKVLSKVIPWVLGEKEQEQNNMASDSDSGMSV
jgi:hypothetical protein